MKTTAARTLDECRARGWLAEKVEKFNQFGGVRQDLFGFIDVVAVSQEHGIIGIQATTRGQLGEHRSKILVDCAEAYEAWCRAGGIVLLWGWYQATPGVYKRPKNAKRNQRWFLWEEELPLRAADPILDAGSL